MMLKPDVALRHNAIWAGLLRRCAQSSTCSHAALLSAQRCRCRIVSERPLSRHETSWELWCHRVRPPPRLPPKRANERGNGSRNGRWEKRETALLVLTLTVFFLVCEQQSTKLRHWYHATYNRYLGRSDGRRGQSDWPMRKKGESRVREMRKRKYWISCLGGYEGCHHVHKHAFIINCTWLLCFSSPVRASKNDLSLFPLFIFVKPSRLRQIGVWYLWALSCPLVSAQARKWKTWQRKLTILHLWNWDLIQIWAVRGYLFLSTQPALLLCQISIHFITFYVAKRIWKNI